MLNAKSFLAVDFGAANVKVTEFALTEAGGLLLHDYGIASLGQEGLQEATREAAMQQVLQQLVAQKGFRSKNINACAPGFHTFCKFVKLPPVDTSKVTQIIQYEAQQNVPFPLEEVVWDYQILGAAPNGELEVMLVAIKSDIVEGLFRVAEALGLRLQLVDVSPAALCNAFRYNYGDLEGCTMLLDIGAKTSNLLFFDKGTVFTRSINIGANSITQDFAKEARLTPAEAERIKIEEGFVSLGGAYEEPENPHQAAISKIARQVMTRLHIQVNQTVQFYRGQQGGSAPERLFLSGGAAVMPYTAQFFSEKLNVPVEYFNPFRNVEIDPALNLEELAKVAHALGESVGLGLRSLAHCPVELNLMPKSSLSRQQFNQKKPYFAAVLACLTLILLFFGVFYGNIASRKADVLSQLQRKVTPLTQNEGELKKTTRDLEAAKRDLEQLSAWIEARSYWADTLVTLREVLLGVEKQKKTEFKEAEVGIWIEKFEPVMPGDQLAVTSLEATSSSAAAPVEPPPPPAQSEDPENENTAAQEAQAVARSGPAPTNAIAYVKLLLRGVNREEIVPSANNQIAYAVAESLKGRTNTFDPRATGLIGNLELDDAKLTFKFEVILKLKRPIPL